MRECCIPLYIHFNSDGSKAMLHKKPNNGTCTVKMTYAKILHIVLNNTKNGKNKQNYSF